MSADDCPIDGDGVITIPLEKEIKMAEAIDLPPNVASGMMAETAGNIQASNRNTRGVFDACMGAIAGTIQQQFSEVGVIEGRSVSGILATPLSSPTTPST
jgi:hypothetical protein